MNPLRNVLLVAVHIIVLLCFTLHFNGELSRVTKLEDEMQAVKTYSGNLDTSVKEIINYLNKNLPVKEPVK